MSRSTAALLIAIMFHILLILLFIFFMNLKPSEHRVKPQEHRIKVSLKEKPKTSKKSAAVKNKIKPIEKAPPMPKGKQLKELVQAPKKAQKTKKVPKKAQEKPKKVLKKKPSKQKKQVQKPTINVKKTIVKKDVNTTKPVKKKSHLYAMLSKKQVTKTKRKSKHQAGTKIGKDFKEAYGEAFGRLSEGEKKYIVDNQEVMRRITQEQLNRLAPVNIPRNLNINTSNIIEFYLLPNGDITGLKLITASGTEILDDTSLQTIEYSYHRYPLPKQKTLIRYKVGYYLGRRH
ncbi:MAG: hypothetical protein COA44_11645 [Arcobacter sp.]|nr:MAG: hypothetical protein COA44_11645 [Arcobacter sp.]